MKNDFFNGNVKKEYIKYVKGTLIFVSAFMVLCSAFIFFTTLFSIYKIGTPETVLLIICPIVFVIGILYPIITVNLIRSYPKHKKLTKLFIVGFVLKDNEK